MRRLLVSLPLFLLPLLASAQGGGGFGSFLRRSSEGAAAYRASRSRERDSFLSRSWERCPIREGVRDPFSPDGGSAPPAEFGIPDGGRLPDPEDLTGPVPPAPEPPDDADGGLRFRFYGRSFRVPYDRKDDFRLPGTSDSDIAGMWKVLSAGGPGRLADACRRIRESVGLGDWAYLQLVDSLSAAVYPAPCNERQMLAGFLLGSTGFRIRFGRSEGRLSCVFCTEQVIYARPYFLKDGAYYYPLTGGGEAWSLSEPSPGRPLDLRLSAAPRTYGRESFSKHIDAAGVEFDYSIPRTLLDFYACYPHTLMHVKADAPVIEALRQSAYPALRSALEGKGEVEAVNLLLRFVQDLMTYRTDDRAWGYEKWNFPEESFLYGFGDCDDHAILFCRLVRDLLGLDTLLVECKVDGGPHAAAAVRFTEPVQGDVILHEGQRYYCCEPTANVARVGRRLWDSYVVTRVDEVR